jgi:hypothetical protein
MAGGSPIEVFNAGAYNRTRFAKQGDLGSVVLPKRPTGTIWTAGTEAKVRWQQTAAHGGGYQYRLCPASRPLTEECFQANPLDFARPDTHFIVFANSSLNREIPATLVRHGGGKGWMKNPLSYVTNNTCDYVVASGQHCTSTGCPKCGAPWWAADGACPCACQDKYPYLSGRTYGSDPKLFPNPLPGFAQTDFAIEDALLVPEDIAAGEYVLGWRWDCEFTSQVWSNCAVSLPNVAFVLNVLCFPHVATVSNPGPLF